MNEATNADILAYHFRKLRIDPISFDEFVLRDDDSFRELTSQGWENNPLGDDPNPAGFNYTDDINAFTAFHEKHKLPNRSAFDKMFEKLCENTEYFFGNLQQYNKQWVDNWERVDKDMLDELNYIDYSLGHYELTVIQWNEKCDDNERLKKSRREHAFEKNEHEWNFALLERLDRVYKEKDPDGYEKRAKTGDLLFKLGLSLTRSTLRTMTDQEFSSRIPDTVKNLPPDDRDKAVDALYTYRYTYRSDLRKEMTPIEATTATPEEMTKGSDLSDAVGVITAASKNAKKKKKKKKKKKGVKNIIDDHMPSDEFMEALTKGSDLSDDVTTEGVITAASNNAKKKTKKKKNSPICVEENIDFNGGAWLSLKSNEDKVIFAEKVVHYLGQKEACKEFVENVSKELIMLMVRYFSCMASCHIKSGDIEKICSEAVEKCEHDDQNTGRCLSLSHFYWSETFRRSVSVRYFETTVRINVLEIVTILQTLLWVALGEDNVQMTDMDFRTAVMTSIERALSLGSFYGDLLIDIVDHAVATGGIFSTNALEDSIFATLHGEVIHSESSSSKGSDTESLDRVAVHEAGHAVAIVYLLQHCEYLSSASIEPRKGSAGVAISRVTAGSSPRRHHGKIAIACFAGRMAELVLFGEPQLFDGESGILRHFSSSGDMDVARHFLGVEASSRYLGYREDVIPKMIKAGLQKAFNKTRKFIEKHREDVKRVANYLRNNKRVYGKAIYKMLGVNVPIVRMINKCFTFDDDRKEKDPDMPDSDRITDENYNAYIAEAVNDEDDVDEAPKATFVLDEATTSEQQLQKFLPDINLTRTIQFPASCSVLPRDMLATKQTNKPKSSA